MLNIVTALKIEAESIIKKFRLKNKNGIYSNDEMNLIITGSGKVKCAINTALLLHKYPYKTINFGICGSSVYDVGEGFYINKITDLDSGFDYYPEFIKGSANLFCLSKAEKYYPLVDMESSGFFEACYKFLSVEKILLYKIVSDTPNVTFNKNIVPKLIESHLHVIEENLEEEKESFVTEIEEYLNSCDLTFYQKNELKNLLIYMKLNNIPFEKVILNNKKEAKEFIKTLKDKITNLAF